MVLLFVYGKQEFDGLLVDLYLFIWLCIEQCRSLLREEAPLPLLLNKYKLLYSSYQAEFGKVIAFRDDIYKRMVSAVRG